MDNSGAGSVGASDAAVLALLADTSRAGRGGWGGGYGEGGYGFGGPYANMSSIQHGIANTAQMGENQADATREIIGQQVDSAGASFENLTRANEFASVNKGVADAVGRICDRLTSIELNNLRESADLARQIAACCCETQKGLLQAQLDAQKCCCETQKLVVAENAATRELINQNTIRAAVDQNNISSTVAGINAAAAANTAAIIAAIQASGGHHGRP